jgi:hypothetical protein
MTACSTPEPVARHPQDPNLQLLCAQRAERDANQPVGQLAIRIEEGIGYGCLVTPLWDLLCKRYPAWAHVRRD